MRKHLAAVVVLLCVLLGQRPQAQTGAARIFFVDIGQGAGTLIVSPTGRTLLVDAGQPGGGTKIGALLDTLGIATIDFTVVTHYHIDHDAGMIELLNAGRVAGIAYDNGDGPDVVPPGTLTSPNSTRGTYLNYVAATNRPGVTRQTIVPGQVIDLGGGMRATALSAGGRLLSGGAIPITNDDLNTESISLLVEIGDFDYIVSGDLTGGGSTSTAKTPDIETYVGQMAGDVDVAQLNHHGSTTTSNQVYLSIIRAEVAVAQIGTNNTFGHPNRETVNKYLNTLTTAGNRFTGTGVPPAGVGPVFYQPEESPAGDDRVSQQGFTGASAANAGQGTVMLETDGVASYTLRSFDDSGTRLNPGVHTYAIDGASVGITTDFAPTVVVQTAPVVPQAAEAVVVSAAVNDRESAISSVALTWSVNGVAQPPVTMTLVGSVFQATIPAQPDGARVDYSVSGTAGAQTTTAAGGYFSGTTPVSALRVLNSRGEPLFFGYGARIRGTVTAGANTFSAGTNDDYVQDATAGINVFRSTDTPTPFAPTGVGQVVDAVGLIGFNGGRLRLDITETLEKTTSPYGITIVSSGPAPVPQTVTIATLLTDPESFEGRLVSIANCQITSGTIPPTPQSLDAFVTVSDGTGSFSLKIDRDTDVEGFNPGTTFTVVGLIQQDDFLRPFDTGYDVTPRGRVDLGGTPAGSELITIAAARVDAIINADGTPGSDFVPDLLNQVVKVRGAVTSIDFRFGNGIEYYIQDATGGVDLFSTSLNAGPFAVGDSVEAIGTVTQFNGLTEIVVSSVALLAPGTIPTATPQVVTLSQLADGGAGEALEGRLIRVDNVSITSGAFPAAGASGNVTITDASGSAALRVDSDTDIDGTTAPAGAFSVIGVLGQFDSSAPLDSGYQLFPRATADIISSGAVTIAASPTSFDFGSVAIGGTAFTTITITNPGTNTVTLTTPFTLAGANPDQFASGAPVTTSLAPGASTTVSVTFQPTSSGAKSATLTIGSSIGSAVVALAGLGQSPTGPASPLVISEFRVRGPSGGNDEFIELYNNTDAPVSIGGYLLRGSNSAGTVGTRATVPAGTTIPARGHYLFTNSAASGYSGATPGDQTYGTGIGDDGGIAITLADLTTIIDQVGMSTGSAFKEGTPLANLGASNQNRSYERRAGGVNGSQQDTDDNADDFQLVTPSDPQNLASTPTPGIRVSPTSIGFGTVVVGGTATATLTIANLSTTATMTLNALTIDGSNAASFSVAAPGATSLAPGETTTVSVTFAPAAAGPHTATLTVPTAANGSVTVALSGAATGGIAVDPAALDFGSQSIGSLSSLPLTIANPTTDTTITLSPPFSLTGANAGEFFAGAPSATTLGPGEVAGLAVGFQPTSVGPKSATLAIGSLNGGTRLIALSGQVACPTLSISGALPAGIVGASYLQTLVGNGGTAPYTFSIASGSLPPGLLLDSSGTVSGSPTTGGTFAVTIAVADVNACSGAAAYSIDIATATLTATPTTVSFGPVAVGASATASLTITNTSAFAVTLVTPFGLGGSAQFTIGDPVAPALAPGASTTATATFAPTAAGAATATVTIASSGGGSTQATLSGTGRLASVSNGIVLSELRFRGPSGPNDEFIELYNTSTAPIDISGYRLLGSNAAGTVSVRATIPAGRTIPAHGHYLFANGAATNGYSGVTPADQTYAIGVTDDGGVGIALANGALVDQVGLSAGSAYGEGAALASLGASNQNRSYERKPGGANGSGIDTGDNASDFTLVSPSDPQALASPVTPALSVSPTAIDFGATPRGSTAHATLTITNSSTTDVQLTTPFAIGGADAAVFSVTAPVSATLAGGAATTVDVSFAPVVAGARSATLTITTAAGESHDVALAGLGANAAPMANPQSLTTIEDTPLAIVLSGSDPETDPLSFHVVAGPGHGSLAGAAPNLTYTPATDFSGPDSFTFKVNDGTVDSPVATVSITVVAALGVTTTAPNGGEKVFANVPVTIQWMAAGAPTGFDVALSRNGGGAYTPIASCTGLPGTARTCVWTPTGPGTTNALVRVTARDAVGTVSDASDAPFTISTSTPTIIVTSPLITLGWSVGTRRAIEWSHNLGAAAFVRVELSRNGGSSWEVLTPSVRNTTATTGAFAWLVSGPTTSSALVRVSWLDGPASDTTDLRFRIVTPEIVVLSPTLNVQWRIGSRQAISWGHNLGTAESVRIEVSRDGGATWAPIASNVPNQTGVLGGYEWTVTGPAANTARIRVIWSGDSAVQDASDVNFRIRP
jgi:beta-lactamase superfamily II metal-dependent hydrolase